MRYVYIIILFAALIVSCKKGGEVEEPKSTYVKLTFWDMFINAKIDSVNLEILNLDKVHLITHANPIVKDLPRTLIKARISKKGYVTKDYTLDFSSRDTLIDNVVLSYDKFILDVPQETLYANSSIKRFSFKVKRNSGFNIQAPSWVKVDTSRISPYEIGITINTTENTGAAHREGEIVFSKGESRRIIPITQYRKNKLHSASAKVGETLSVHLELMDDIVDAPNILKLGYHCLTDIKYEKVDGKNIHFTSSCVNLTTPLEFKIYVKNNGGLDTLDLTVKFYDKVIALNPYEEQMSVFYNKIESPNLFYGAVEAGHIGEIDINEFVIKRRFKLPEIPTDIVYNAYNKSYYALGRDNKIRIIDVPNGVVLQTIEIPVDLKTDHPQYPYIYPGSLVFNKNGYGLMVTGAKGASGNGVRSIDSKNGHKMVVLDDLGHLEDVQQLPNQIDFLINEAHSNYHFIFDVNTKKFTHSLHRFYFLQHKSLAINQHNDLVNYDTNQKISYGLSFRSSVLDKERELWYGWTGYYSSNYLGIMDFQGKILNKIPAYQSNFFLTKDAKYLIFASSNGDLFRIPSKIFHERFSIL
jgi:hypothetical protein